MALVYQIIRSKRKTIAIQITPSGEVLVRAPLRLSSKEIQAFVESKKGWITKHLSKYTQEEVLPFRKDELHTFRKETATLVAERVAYFADIMGVTYHLITIRAQRSRWGSCSSKGNLNFNCLLALVPSEVLDYVVVHELCHLKEMNHSAAFWAEVEKILPDYSAQRQWLKNEGNALIRRIP